MKLGGTTVLLTTSELHVAFSALRLELSITSVKPGC